MLRPPPDYFRYFARGPDLGVWGLGVTAAGHTRIRAGTGYPPAAHPADHALQWTRGRVLEAMQIVLITEGRGRFESRASGLRSIQPGDAFVVLPGVWHRYEPEPDTGWVESWVEVVGPTVDRLVVAGIFQVRQPVRSGLLEAGLAQALAVVHERCRTGPPGFDAGRAAAALQVLAAWWAAEAMPRVPTRIGQAVARAEQYLADHYTEPVNVAQLARRLGVAYSHFRRAFRRRTGLAPWQYVLQLRLRHARRLLAAGDAKLEDIAEQLGFSSAFHLSSAFKAAYGLSPDRWRRQVRPIR